MIAQGEEEHRGGSDEQQRAGDADTDADGQEDADPRADRGVDGDARGCIDVQTAAVSAAVDVANRSIELV